jgi:DNA-binding SARP family transcriptional activator
MIRLSLLGTVDLRGPEDEELRTVLSQPKRLALLAYLAIARPSGLHSRDTLLALLWPELNQEHGRAALRQALYVLRQALGGEVMLSFGDGVIGLDHRRLWCDVRAFSGELDQGRRAEALGHYGGELLAGFHVAGVPEFERWLDGERVRLAVRAATATWNLLECAKQRGESSEALEWAFRLLAINQDDERALREVITLLDHLGDRIAAIRMYRAFAHRIAADYGIQPASETEALVSSIRTRGPRATQVRLANPASPR